MSNLDLALSVALGIGLAAADLAREGDFVVHEAAHAGYRRGLVDEVRVAQDLAQGRIMRQAMATLCRQLHDPARDGALQTERRPDGDDGVTDDGAVAVAEPRVWLLRYTKPSEAVNPATASPSGV